MMRFFPASHILRVLLVSVGVLLLYTVLSRRGRPFTALIIQFAALALYAAIALFLAPINGFLFGIPLAVPLACAADIRLRSGRPNWRTQLALITAALIPLLLSAAERIAHPYIYYLNIVLPLFPYLWAVLYLPPLLLYEQHKKLCLLWFITPAAPIVILALHGAIDYEPLYGETLIGEVSRIVFSEGSIIFHLASLPVLASLPAFFYNLRCVKRGAST